MANISKQPQIGTGIVTFQDVMTPGLAHNHMNQYRSKDGREVIMHNNKTHVTTEDGTEWTRVDTRIVVPSAAIPQAVTAGPDAKDIPKAPAPTTPPKK